MTIHVEGSSSGEEIIATITDSGVGLSAQDANRLGEPFFSKRPGGIGLGFSLAKRIIKEHGGSIVLESDPGQGASVFVHLPAYVPLSPQSECEADSL